MCVGFATVDVALSPKFHNHCVGAFVDVSLNCTLKGSVPTVTLLVKFVDGVAALTVPVKKIQKNKLIISIKIDAFFYLNF